MLSAIALTGAMTFTSCSSEDDIQAEVNPTFDGEAVKTTFSISIGDVKGTRMSEESVQADNLFHGMTDIYLFPSKGVIDEDKAFDLGYIHLPDFDAFDAGAGSAGELLTAQAKRYKDVTFALGVDHFLFYAATATSNKDQGELKPSYLAMSTPAWEVTSNITSATTPADITFDLVPYQKGKTIDDVKTTGATTVTALNNVYLKMKEEAEEAAAATPTRDAVATRLNNLCDTLKNGDRTAANTPQYFAGSALSIQELIEDIYNSLYVANAATVLTGDDLTDYTTYYEPVIDEILALFDVTDNTATTGQYDLEWHTDNDFPKTELGLPDGAVAIIFTAENEATKPFDYTAASADGMAVADVDKYVHPARLYYTINTPSMVKNAAYLFSNEVGGKTWGEISEQYAEGAVTATTQSVIMKDQVQYAVGRLDIKAQVKTGVTILDSGSGIAETADKDPQPVAVPDAGYTLTGVLIGGQKQVDWQFKPVTSSAEYTIFDDVTSYSTAAKSGVFTEMVHTLALETATDGLINVALEFVNTGKDFYGIDHKLIPAGAKFYLVAQLDPRASNLEHATNQAAAGNKVFKQDFTTTAQMTIGATSLAKAYNIIPDLRSPKLEFGLSVNLEWQSGITFTQEF